MSQLFITIDDQIACVERELGYRNRVYARGVASGGMSKKKADYEIEVMTEVLNTLKKLKS